MGRGIEGAIATLAAIGERYPLDQAPRFEPPASPGEIAALESAVGSTIPAAVRSFLEQTRAVVAMDIRNGYWIGGPAELSRAMGRGDFPTIVDAGGRPTRVIAIATDGGGNAFVVAADLGTVWRWNHETASVKHVARDFSEFLHRVAEDWTHDLDGDDAWDYLV